MSSQNQLPNYVCIDDPRCANRHILREKAGFVTFPLSDKIKKAIVDLECKFDSEPVRVGLAAPQIGHPYHIMIFEVLSTPELKKFRSDLTQSMPKTIWINSIYEPIGLDVTYDWEACFSIQNHTGYVKRHQKIRYEAITPQGQNVSGTAEGFLARVIQHEIDHLNGKLCLDNVPLSNQKTWEEYRAIRQARIEAL